MEEISIYELITQLCDKFARNQKDLKHLRSLSYEILLGKRSKLNDEQTTSKYKSSMCELWAWQFTLSNQFGLEENSHEIGEYGEIVRELFGDSVLKFLLCLKQIPENSDESLEVDLCEDFKQLFNIPSKISTKTCLKPVEEILDKPSIWEIAAREKFCTRRTWEAFGLTEPEKEQCFVSELGENSNYFIESLPSVYLSSVETNKNQAVRPKLVSSSDFVKNIKLLLVGLESDSFRLDSCGNFYLVPNLTVSGIAPDTLSTFCGDLLVSGRCFRLLNEISTFNTNREQIGYIFTEFCKSLQRYLKLYKIVILNCPDNIGVIKIDNLTREFRKHLKTLATICRLDSKNNVLPHGILLLNYLYQTVLTVVDKKLLLILYSILFPCCQVYFNRFLQQWLLDGVVNDPFDEFFIKPNYKYTGSRGRTYWTRGYVVKDEIVPDFLLDLKNDVLDCGKAMNLLKLSVKTSKFCLYLMGKKPLIISCCVTSEQLSLLEQNVTSYYLEMLSECGPLLNLEQIIKRNKEQDPIFVNLIARKRAVSLQRRELERQRKYLEERERKMDEFASLREQYDSVIQQKQARIASEIEKEMKLIEFNLNIEQTRHNLIEKESKILIDYYTQLSELSEKRKKTIEKRIEILKAATLDNDQNIDDNNSSSNESFYSVGNPEIPEDDPKPVVHSSKSMDILNANNEEQKNNEEINENIDLNINKDKTSEIEHNNKKETKELDTFAMARKIKAKVLSQEMGIFDIEPIKPERKTINYENMTDLQRNRLKVLNSEFGLGIITEKPQKIPDKKSSHDIFHNCLDNDNILNQNHQEEKKSDIEIRKSVSLTLELSKPEHPQPMSVDSTPMSDSTTFSKLLSTKSDICSLPTTSETQIIEEPFDFQTNETNSNDEKNEYIMLGGRSQGAGQIQVFSKRLNSNDLEGVMQSCLKFYMHDSVSLPLGAQLRLAHSELLKYFINNGYFQHLNSLRNYFFLLNGEFAKNVTEKLFECLYEVKNPVDLINVRSLHNLIFGALEKSCGSSGDDNNNNNKYGNCLSFKMNTVPMRFDLGDPDVLQCISMTYKVNWPMNILLPNDTLSKYDEVFKYLLKINRVAWVLKKICLDSKALAKESGKKEIYLMMSPHYQRLHQCRHVMFHFIQTFQNYIVGEVLHTSWEIFEQNLATVSNIDGLYAVHTSYIKNILFLCLLNKKAEPLQRILQKIFKVILKFCELVRSRSWKCEDGQFVHPNFRRLQDVFHNFDQFVVYLFKAGFKVAKSGYQPHLIQLLDMLDVNGFYSNKLQ